MLTWLARLVGIDMITRVVFDRQGDKLTVRFDGMPVTTYPFAFVVFHRREFVVSGARRYHPIVVCQSWWVADQIAKIAARFNYGLDEFDLAAIDDRALIARYGVLPLYSAGASP